MSPFEWSLSLKLDSLETWNSFLWKWRVGMVLCMDNWEHGKMGDLHFVVLKGGKIGCSLIINYLHHCHPKREAMDTKSKSLSLSRSCPYVNPSVWMRLPHIQHSSLPLFSTMPFLKSYARFNGGKTAFAKIQTWDRQKFYLTPPIRPLWSPKSFYRHF